MRWRDCVGPDAIKDSDFAVGHGELRRRSRGGSIDHGEPEDAPAENAEDRDQVDEPLCRTQPRIFGPAV